MCVYIYMYIYIYMYKERGDLVFAEKDIFDI